MFIRLTNAYKLSPKVRYLLRIRAIESRNLIKPHSGLGVIRMVKLFGWEPYMLEQLAQRRDGELAELRRFRVLSTIMDIVNAGLPLLSKITVISLYVRLRVVIRCISAYTYLIIRNPSL